MKLSEIIAKLNLEKITNFDQDVDISDAYVSDLLSDVMGNGKSGQIWITIQSHKNVTAVASLKDMPAVIIIGTIKPDEDMVEHAKDEGICLLVSKESCFTVCGKLYQLISAN